MYQNKKKGFTLVELLTVIAIIGILAAIVIPVTGMVQDRANIAKTRAQFNNYLTAMENFRGTYGYYPRFETGGTTTSDYIFEFGSGPLSGDPAKTRAFVETLSGRPFGGGTSLTGYPAEANRRRIEFLSVSEGELSQGEAGTRVIQDSFGNQNIRIAIDADNNGVIELSAAQSPTGRAETIQARVVMYSMPDEGAGFPGIASWE